MGKELWKGNEAVAEALIRSGLDFFAGYPITPSTEILEYLSYRMPELGRVFMVQAMWDFVCAELATSRIENVSNSMAGLKKRSRTGRVSTQRMQSVYL